MESMTGVDWAKIEPSEALAQLMRQDREREPDAPIGGWRGEWAVQRHEPPPPSPPQPFVIRQPTGRPSRPSVIAWGPQSAGEAGTGSQCVPRAAWCREGAEVAVKTVYGRLADPLGHASASGRAWASPAAAYLREQNPEIRVDVDHSYVWCGSILFLARHAGCLWAVGEVDDSVSESVRLRVGSQTVEVPTKLYLVGEPHRQPRRWVAAHERLADAVPGQCRPSPGRLPRRQARSPAGGAALALTARQGRVRAAGAGGERRRPS